MNHESLSYRHVALRVIAVLFTSLAGLTAQAVEVEGDYAIVDVSVIPMTSETVLPGQTVVVSDGVISHIGPARSVRLAETTRRIDGSGKFLLPGLSDMHDHIMGPETLKLQLAYGVTTVRNMFGSPEALEWRAAVARGDLLGPQIVCGTPLIDDDPPYFKGSATLTRPEDADAFVADMKAQGYDFLKPYELLKEDVYVAMMKAADKHGMRVEGHIPQKVDPRLAIELGQDSIEHGMRIDAYILADGIPWGGSFRSREMIDLIARINSGELSYEQAFDRDKLRELSRLMVEHGTALVPTLSVVYARGWNQADRERIASHPNMKYVAPMMKGFWLKPMDPDKQEMINENVLENFSDEELASLQYYSTVEYGKWVKIMHEEGVLLLGGVDAPNPGMFHGLSLHDELRHFVELAGFTPFEAIETVTINPARHWGVEGRRGVIAANAEADLLLLAANPIEDIRNTLAIEGVMVDGRWLDRAELDAMLHSVEESYRAMAEAAADAEAEAEAGQAESGD